MDVLLCPVQSFFTSVYEPCIKAGGFVVGPIGSGTAGRLLEFAASAGLRDPDFPHRYSFV